MRREILIEFVDPECLVFIKQTQTKRKTDKNKQSSITKAASFNMLDLNYACIPIDMRHRQ